MIEPNKNKVDPKDIAGGVVLDSPMLQAVRAFMTAVAQTNPRAIVCIAVMPDGQSVGVTSLGHIVDVLGGIAGANAIVGAALAASVKPSRPAPDGHEGDVILDAEATPDSEDFPDVND